MRRLACLGLFLASIAAATGPAGCAAGGDGSDTDEVTAPIDDSGKADASTELRVRAGDTTLWMTQQVARRETANGPELVLHGHTSRNLTDGRGFIFDDVYGDWFKKSARTFDLTFALRSNARGLVDGVPEFIQLGFDHSSTRPDVLYARTIVRPRLQSFSGSSHLYITAELTPVVSGGRTVYRIKGHTTGASDFTSFVQVQLGDQAITDTRVIDQTRFEIDLQPDQAIEAVGTATDLVITTSLPSGTVSKRARLGLSIKKLGLTAGDVEAVWPPITCTSTVKSCLLAQADGTVDLGACGEAIAVNACAGQVGVFVDDTAFVGVLHDADLRLVTPQWRADGIGLVGADRVEAFLDNAKQMVESNLEDLFGRWYLSATTRDAALSKALEDGLDTMTARPLDWLEPRTPAPGDVAATRQLVADAVLAHVGSMDLRVTEWGKPMEQLVHEFRAQHVQSIRNFRESVSPEPWPTHPEWDLYVGDWLGAYVEVTVLKSTGEVVNVLLEID